MKSKNISFSLENVGNSLVILVMSIGKKYQIGSTSKKNKGTLMKSLQKQIIQI